VRGNEAQPRQSAEAVEFARAQRSSANEFANTIWQWVRNRQVCGQKFRREYAIPPYTVDFCCVELKLIIESDGLSILRRTGGSGIACVMSFLKGTVIGSCGLLDMMSCANRGLASRGLKGRWKSGCGKWKRANPLTPDHLPEAGRGGMRHHEFARKRRLGADGRRRTPKSKIEAQET